MTAAARGPELTSLSVAKNFRTDVPAENDSRRETAPVSYFLPALVLIGVTVVFLIGYFFFW